MLNFISIFYCVQVEGILAKSRYVCGGRLIESDIRLFVTLIRFDHMYHGHFKVLYECDLKIYILFLFLVQ